MNRRPRPYQGRALPAELQGPVEMNSCRRSNQEGQIETQESDCNGIIRQYLFIPNLIPHSLAINRRLWFQILTPQQKTREGLAAK